MVRISIAESRRLNFRGIALTVFLMGLVLFWLSVFHEFNHLFVCGLFGLDGRMLSLNTAGCEIPDATVRFLYLSAPYLADYLVFVLTLVFIIGDKLKTRSRFLLVFTLTLLIIVDVGGNLVNPDSDFSMILGLGIAGKTFFVISWIILVLMVCFVVFLVSEIRDFRTRFKHDRGM